MILLLSSPDDGVERWIAAHLDTNGVPYLVFDPAQLLVDERCLVTGDRRAVFEVGGHDVLDVSAIHFRRPTPPAWVSQNRTEDGRSLMQSELLGLMDVFWDLHEDTYVIGAPRHLSPNKITQQRLAARLGMVTPRYCVTNSAQVARTFWHHCDGRVITKCLGVPKLPARTLYTSRIEDEAWLDDVEASPIFLQEEIPKSHELRVTVVGERCFTVRINSQDSPKTALDWRHLDEDVLVFEPVALAPEIERFCVSFLKQLGLVYGAFDFAVREDGQPVFFECNVNGEFGWVESETGLPISQTIAGLLTDAHLKRAA